MEEAVRLHVPHKPDVVPKREMTRLARRTAVSLALAPLLACAGAWRTLPPADACWVVGTAIDEPTWTGAVGVQIEIVGPAEARRVAVTDRDGHYRLRLAPGRHTLRARRIGYHIEQRAV